ncbi:hypothetical protein AURDEDRAFT_169106 [Auricularia subglabra TFB-10046 SS5]|nr:hypothetical protein AURDEDRAFT_169106 [Auricularia subglabra TFB-10046 SS5]
MSDSSRETRTSNAGAHIKTFRNGDMPQDGLRNEQMKGTYEGKSAGNDAIAEAGGVLGSIADKAKGVFGAPAAANANDKP